MDDLRELVEKMRQNLPIGIEKEQLEAYEREKAEKEWTERMTRAGIGKRYKDCTFERMDARVVPAQVACEYQSVKDYAASFNNHMNEGIGLLLKGPVGTMKTSMAVAALQYAMKNGRSGMFITMPSLLDTIFSLKDQNKEEWSNFENRLRNVDMLLLDDLGAEHTEGWVLTKVDAIISERYNRMKPLIITTNLTGDKLKSTYAARVIDRIRSTSIEITFAGASLRQKGA